VNVASNDRRLRHRRRSVGRALDHVGAAHAISRNVAASETRLTGACTTLARLARARRRQISVDASDRRRDRTLEEQTEVALELAVVAREDDVDVIAQPFRSMLARTRPIASSISSTSTALSAFTSRTCRRSSSGHPLGRCFVVAHERPSYQARQ